MSFLTLSLFFWLGNLLWIGFMAVSYQRFPEYIQKRFLSAFLGMHYKVKEKIPGLKMNNSNFSN